MKSETSFFNGTVLRKDITRFAPVWGLYTVFLLLMLLILRGYSRDMLADMTCSGFFSIVNLIYAGICAAFLFGDLFQSRMCNMLHAMPMRREGWFLTHVAAGALFSFVPNLLFSLAAVCLLGSPVTYTLVWFATTGLTFLFFFGAGCLSALCAGNRFAMLTVYTILNYLAVLVYAMASTVYRPLLYGFVLDSDAFLFFSPAAFLPQISPLTPPAWDAVVPLYTINWSAWNYLFAIAALGLVMMGLAVWIYRRRALESAGDFISLKPLSPIFLVIYTLGVGTLLYAFVDMLFEEYQYEFLAVGILVGFFTGKMLLERTVKVFRLKIWGRFAIFAVVFFLSIGIARQDPLGITQYVPAPENVKSVSVSTGYPYRQWQMESPEDIRAALTLHRVLLENRADESGYTFNVELVYTLENGNTVRREYPVARNSAQSQAVAKILSNWQYLFRTNADWDSFSAGVQAGRIYGFEGGDIYFEKEDVPDFLAALYADCEAGLTAQAWDLHRMEEEAVCWLDLTYAQENGQIVAEDLTIYTGCTNLVAFCKQMAEKYDKVRPQW